MTVPLPSFWNPIHCSDSRIFEEAPGGVKKSAYPETGRQENDDFEKGKDSKKSEQKQRKMDGKVRFPLVKNITLVDYSTFPINR